MKVHNGHLKIKQNEDRKKQKSVRFSTDFYHPIYRSIYHVSIRRR